MTTRFFLIAILIAAVLPAVAQDQEPAPPPEFDVELIVFRHLIPDNSEIPVIEKQPAEADRDEPGETGQDEPEIELRRFSPLSTDQLRLGGASTNLLNSKDWSPILHYGWRQPVLGRQEGPAVSIAGNRLGAFAAGTVRLTVERFLRIEVDLQMDPGSGVVYRMDQSRRLRSGELHYFDHPQFGVLVLVSRTDQE